MKTMSRILCGTLVTALALTGCAPPDRQNYPYFVDIGGGSCGGSVIAPDWVLTAARCVDGRPTTGVGPLVDQLIGQVTPHPLWNHKVHDGHDLALVHVDRSLTPAHTPIQVGAPFNPGAYAASTQAKIMGPTAEDGRFVGFQVANTVLHSDDYMDDIYNKIYGFDHWIESLMIGAGDRSPTTCFGGSGGPLVVDLNGQPVQVGVDSFAKNCDTAAGFAELFGPQLAWVASVVPAVRDGWGGCTTANGAPGRPAVTYGTDSRQGPGRDGSNYWNITCVSTESLMLQARHSNLCANVVPAGLTNANILVQGGCGGDLYSRLERVPTGDGYDRLVVVATGKCLAVHDASTSLRAQVVQAECGSGDHRQWNLVPTDSGYYKIVNRHSTLCLDVQGDYTGPGALIWQFDCDGDYNQQFRPFCAGAPAAGPPPKAPDGRLDCPPTTIG